MKNIELTVRFSSFGHKYVACSEDVQGFTFAQSKEQVFILEVLTLNVFILLLSS